MRNSNDIQPLRVVKPSEDATDEPDETISVEGHKPLVPEGEYLARYIGHETAVLFSRAKKVALRFEICEGPYQRTRLTRYYRAQQLIGKPGPGGRFQLSAGGDLYRMLARVLDVRTRPDRISVRELRTRLLRIKVRTVTRDRDNRPLPESCHYSVIDAIEDGR